MSAERLREAARILRERAGACEPWRGDDDNGSWAEEYNPVAYEKEHGGDDSDIAFIATMHPGVALALADWIDCYAAVVASGHPIAFDVEATAVADAILGGAS